MKTMGRAVWCVILMGAMLFMATASARAEAPPKPVPEESRNAALIYWQAFANLQEPEEEALSDKMYDIVAGRQPFDPSDEAIAELIKKNEMALRTARRASHMPFCDFQPDVSRGFSTLLAHLAKIRNTARLLILQAKQFESQGKWPQAVENYLAAVRMGIHGANDKTIISTLVCISVAQQATQRLNECLTSMPADADLAESVSAHLAELASASEPFRTGLEGERHSLSISVKQLDQYAALVAKTVSAMSEDDRKNLRLDGLLDELDKRIPETSPEHDGLQYEGFLVVMIGRAMGVAPDKMMQELFSGTLHDKVNAIAAEILLDDELLKAIETVRRQLQDDLTEIISFLDRILALAELSFVDSVAAVNAINEEIIALPPSRLAAVVLPALNRYYGCRGEYEELLATTRSVALLHAYKARHGSYPASLADLPEAPKVNPRTGKPFVYEITGKGYRLTVPATEEEEERVLHEAR